MTRRKKNGNRSEGTDWKSRFVFYGPSIEEEREIRDYVGQGKLLDWEAFIEELVSNGGSIKISHSNSDGGVFITLSPDKEADDYGGYNFGMSYPTLPGCLAIADWFYHTRLLTDRGLKYLPIRVEDWLVLP